MNALTHAKQLRKSSDDSIKGFVHLGQHLERMIDIQKTAYPDSWSDDEKRDSAIKHLGFEKGK